MELPTQHPKDLLATSWCLAKELLKNLHNTRHNVSVNMDFCHIHLDVHDASSDRFGVKKNQTKYAERCSSHEKK